MVTQNAFEIQDTKRKSIRKFMLHVYLSKLLERMHRSFMFFFLIQFYSIHSTNIVNIYALHDTRIVYT